ncbi:MAG: hypothetical protein A370_03357, partial [Clostridium sp. Maddingley MBC34-26]
MITDMLQLTYNGNVLNGIYRVTTMRVKLMSILTVK